MIRNDRATELLANPRLRGNNARLAALWARLELDASVNTVLADHGWNIDGATMRSKLLCLRVAQPTIAEAASSARHGLSAACHHHAYELAPTVSEVEDLIGLVAEVRAAAVHGDGERSTP